MAQTNQKTKKPLASPANVDGYYVSGNRGVMLRSGEILPEYTKLVADHDIREDQFEMLRKAGYVRKGIGKSPISIFTSDQRPMIQENLSKEDSKPRSKKVPKNWVFTDEQLKGKELDQLNTLIVERGGEPQESEEDAIILLQSELEE